MIAAGAVPRRRARADRAPEPTTWGRIQSLSEAPVMENRLTAPDQAAGPSDSAGQGIFAAGDTLDCRG